VVDATLRSGMPITLFRLWHCRGRYLFSAIEGESVEPRRHLRGTNGLGHFPDEDIHDYFLRMVRAGYPHHPVVAAGHVKRQLTQVMAALDVRCLG
jgi:hypothetical protein